MHQAVLLHEVLEYLNLAPGKKILDCTIGGGGHARAILELITPSGILVGIDQDQEVLELATNNLKEFQENISLIRGNFINLERIFLKHSIGKVDGVLFDLGLSSFQLEKKERGFSIKLNGPLDMRMDRDLKIDAGYLVNNLSAFELAGILKRFGQERGSRRIARTIVKERPIKSTHQLADLVLKALGPRSRYTRIHPATKTFQALRIAVNSELEALESALDVIPRFVNAGGRICIISFHSLEDRIVKNRFKDYQTKNILKIITKKPITPQREEVLINPRARSAKLRTAERL